MSDSLLLLLRRTANGDHRPARLERKAAAPVVFDPGVSSASGLLGDPSLRERSQELPHDFTPNHPPHLSHDLPVALAEAGSEQRWRQLQRIRRGSTPLAPWITALAGGQIPAEADLLAALWPRLDRQAVAHLLTSVAADDPAPWLTAGQLELPPLAAQPAAREVWLEPLLQRHQEATGEPALAWLQLLGQLRDPRVAARLRCVLAPLAQDPVPAAGVCGGLSLDRLQVLLPLLGLQREPQDAELLQAWAVNPGPRVVRRAALEGLAVGLSSWPTEPLARALSQLARDLDPGLAGTAVDLLARLPHGRRLLGRLLGQALDPGVRARLRRRLPPTPLVLLVHGRQGGVIPAELEVLAAELSQRRGAPVLLQALTAEAPEADAAFWAAARRAEGLSLVPLLLLPGGHVRRDLPAIARAWRVRAGELLSLRRLPFLGAWPAWQRALAQSLATAAAVQGAEPVWLHHPLEGALPQRFLRHLAGVLRAEGQATPYSAGAADLGLTGRGPVLLLPLTLAANRLSESLTMGALSSMHVLPPLLNNQAMREVLLTALEELP